MLKNIKQSRYFVQKMELSKKIKQKFSSHLDKRRYSKNPLIKNMNRLRDEISKKGMVLKERRNKKLFMVSKKAIYFNIAKNAMSSIIKNLSENTEALLVEKSNNQIKEEYPHYYKFTFVRNPYDRLVSCYEDKINNEEAEDYLEGIFKGFLKYGQKFWRKMSFKDFAKNVASIPDKYSDPHFRSQYKYITDKKGDVIVDFIGKIENLEKDYKKVTKKMGIKNSSKLSHKRKSKRKRDWREYYDEETKKLVYRRYKKDFELFGYSPQIK